MARHLDIHFGDHVYVAGDGRPVGAVRDRPDEGSVVVYIENAGDFLVPLEAIESAAFGRLVLRRSRLGAALARAVAHAADVEDYPPDEDIELEEPVDEAKVESQVRAPERHTRERGAPR
jgi:hypothetical protein